LKAAFDISVVAVIEAQFYPKKPKEEKTKCLFLTKL